MGRKLVLFALVWLFSCGLCFSELSSVSKLSPEDSSDLAQAALAYQNEDWLSAVFFFKKLVSAPGSASDENYFMLIKSEIYAGEYREAQSDCENFLAQFPSSPYSEYVEYQNGRLLHLVSRNEDAILRLSDFCHENPKSELYPSALFWIGEAFYAEYNFDSARGLYERIVNDYPSCDKVSQAQYKIDLIDRRSREEKLLYLLKVIGEENLSTREEYERQLRAGQIAGSDPKVYDFETETFDEKENPSEISELPSISLSEDVVAESEVKNEIKDESLSLEEEAPDFGSVKQKSDEGKGKPLYSADFSEKQVVKSVKEPSILLKQVTVGNKKSVSSDTNDISDDAALYILKLKSKELRRILEEEGEGISK